MTELLCSLPAAHLAQSGDVCRFVSDTASRYPAPTAIAIGILVLVLLLLVWRWRRSRRDFSVYTDEGGAATVSRKALRHLIRMICEEVGTPGSPCIRLSQKRNRVNVALAVKLYQSQRLSAVHEQLRRRIRATFEETHGILLGEVSLKVTGFKKNRHTEEYEADFISPPAAATNHAHDEDLSSEGIVIASGAMHGDANTRRTAGSGFGAASYSEADEHTDADEEEKPGTDAPRKRSFFSFGRSKKFDVDPQDVEDADADSGQPGADSDKPKN